MNKEVLDKSVESFKNTTREALQTFYDALPHGQQQKILKKRNRKRTL
jgi:hypothetical protein